MTLFERGLVEHSTILFRTIAYYDIAIALIDYPFRCMSNLFICYVPYDEKQFLTQKHVFAEL